MNAERQLRKVKWVNERLTKPNELSQSRRRVVDDQVEPFCQQQPQSPQPRPPK